MYRTTNQSKPDQKRGDAVGVPGPRRRRDGRWLLTAGVLGVIAVSLTVVALTSMGATKSASMMKPDDGAIITAVDDALFNARGVSPRLIEINSEDGVVTLQGEVDSLLARTRAAHIAERINGVRAVVNELNIAETGRSDAKIRSDVVAALATDPATDAWPITVKSDNGTVKLQGRVDSWQQRWLAERIATGVAGVRGIDNQLDVVYESQRPDAEIAAEIRDRLKWDSRIDDVLLNVEVTGGKVYLSGKVGSALEKSLAQQFAWTNGVSSVDASKLAVVDWLKNDMRRYDRFTHVTDADIRQAATDALMYDPRVYSFTPKVDVMDGMVTLRGTVDNLKAKNAAAQDASNTVGVWYVDNRLKVQPLIAVSNAAIMNDVSSAFERDPMLHDYDLFIDVDNGTVTLRGRVKSLYERSEAEEVASRITGVSQIDNLIDVSDNVPTYEAYKIYDWDPLTFDLDFGRDKNLSDPVIHERIERQMHWSPFVNAENVRVSVDHGVATLTGTVNSWYERHDAARDAYAGGASHVINRLKVRYGPADHMDTATEK